MISKFKIVSLIVAFVCFVAIFVFHNTIFSAFVEYSVKSYCKNFLSTTLTADKVKYEDYLLIFEQPVFSCLDDEEFVLMRADQLRVFVEPDFLTREINLYVTLVDATMDLAKMTPLFTKLLHEDQKDTSFFKINHQIQVVNGILQTKENDEIKETYVDVTQNFIGNKELKIQARTQSVHSEENSFSFDLSEDISKCLHAHADFKNFSCKTFNQFLNLITPDGPFQLFGGVIDGNVAIVLERTTSKKNKPQVREIISDLVLDKLSWIYKPLNIYGEGVSCELQFTKNKGFIDLKEACLLAKLNDSILLEFNQLKGNGLFEFDFLLRHEPLRTLDANFFVKDGFLKLETHELPLLTQFKIDLQIDKGLVKQSTAKGKLFGLDGKMEFDFFNPDQLMTFNFAGKTDHLLPLFKKEDLLLKGHVRKIIDALSLSQVFSFDGVAEIDKEALFFGFELEAIFINSSQDLAERGKAMSDEEDRSREAAAGRIADEFMKVAELEGLGGKIAKSGYVTLQNGWLQASHLDLKKYVAPFIIQDDQTRLTGYGDFQGTFNDQFAEVSYDLEGVVIENRYFAAEVADIKGAKEVFNLKTGESFGKIPIKNGSCFEKNHGLLFTDIAADFIVSDAKLSAPFIETFCNGIYFAGSQEVDLSHPDQGECDLFFHISRCKGKFSQVQDIFSRFNKPYFFLKIPLEGDVALRQNGADLHLNLKGESCNIIATVQGELLNGEIKSDQFDVSCQEINVNFDYDYEANHLTFTDISGTVLVGKPECAEEYLFSGDHICFTDYLNSEAEFDLWVGDKNRDMIRIAGHTELKGREENQELIEIFLNKECSHFGNMQLTSFKCVLKDWTEIDALGLKFSFKLGHLLTDLQRFGRTGFFFLSSSLLKGLNELKKASGDFLVTLEYDKTRSHFNYHMTGKEIEVGSYLFDQAVLKGKKNGHLWSIEELKLDQFSAAADIIHQDNFCKINFLGMQMASSLLVGLEGEYRPEEQAIISQVNLFEADFERLDEWPKLKSFIEEFNPQGKMHATGQLKVEFGKEFALPQVDLLLNASFENCQLKGVQFNDAKTVSCHYLSNQGVVLRGINTAVSEALLEIGKMEYDVKNRAFFIEEMHFKIPEKELVSIANRLGNLFPQVFSKPVLSVLTDVKKEDCFEGSLNLEISKPHYALSLYLKDGIYYLLGKDHRIEGFVLDIDPCEFKLSTQYHFGEIPFDLNLHSKSETLEFGKLVLRDKGLNEEETPLTIYWRKGPNHQFAIETVDGQFAGLNAHLYRNPEIPLDDKKIHMVGEVNFDMSRLKWLLPPQFKETFQNLTLGAGYTFKGNWSFFNGKEFDLFDSTFKGELIGSDFECKGYQFQTLLADVEYQKNQLLFNRFHIDDPCGTFYADEIQLLHDEKEGWKVKIPLAEGKDFRPSLVRSAGVISTLSRRPFVIDQLELEHLEGCLLDPCSFKGYGRFSFKNPHKKNLQNTILAIPAEIISRLGLDLAILTPVIGTVEYQILDHKILLNKFKDIYSEGKLSKFYLAETPYPSYIDFDGNLFLKLKMRHNNLLFKLTELFIVNVQGNLKKPIYSFQKQNKPAQELNSPINEI